MLGCVRIAGGGVTLKRLPGAVLASFAEVAAWETALQEFDPRPLVRSDW